MSRKIYTILSLVLIGAFALAACAAPATSAPTQAPAPTTAPAAAPTTAPAATNTAAPKPVTINWWHISTADPGLSFWAGLAKQYMAAHPNVTINITVLENEAFKTKLTTVLQSGNPPDIFQSWGGGDMNSQVQAGLLQDITPALDADNGAWRSTFGAGALSVYA